MNVKLIEPSDFTRWENYIMSHPDATLYHRIGWRNIIGNSFGHKTYYLMATQGTTVAGVLPIVHIRSILFGSIMCSMPFLNFGGICANDKETEDALLVYATDILKKENGDYLELRHLKQTSASLPQKTHKVSMTIELDSDPEVLWNKYNSKHRQTIRKASKNGLEIRFGRMELLKDFYQIMSRGWRDLGTPIYSCKFFQHVLEDLKESVEIGVVYYQQKPVATALVGFHGKTVEGMWLSFLREFSKLQINYFQYWEMIKRACEQGYGSFHLGRSTAEGGGEFFKEKWNAVPKQLYWEYVLNKRRELPELNVDNPRYRSAIKLWRTLPVSVTTLIGPGIAKSIP